MARIKFDHSTFYPHVIVMGEDKGIEPTGVWLEATPCTPDGHSIDDILWAEMIEYSKGLEYLDGHSAMFKVFLKTDHSEFYIGKFHLSSMPGCCGVCVSHYAELTPENRHKGLRWAFRDIKGYVGSLMGYSAMIATSEVENIPAFMSMQKSGYSIDHTFVNRRTNHVLAFGFKELKKLPDKS